MANGDEGRTPQGAVVSPLLANIYLHYVYDLWAEQWRGRSCARCDDRGCDTPTTPPAGFEHRADAERSWHTLRIRLAEFRPGVAPRTKPG